MKAGEPAKNVHAKKVIPTGASFRWHQNGLGRLLYAARRIVRGLMASLMAVFAIAGITWISFRLGLDLASVGFFYLVAVVMVAVYGGVWQATFVSVISVGCLDFFFSDPIFSFTVGRVASWVELGAFEFTAVVISQLSNRAHLRELEAVAERRDTERLYQAARRVLLLENPTNPGSQVASLIRDVFNLDDVILFDAAPGLCHRATVAPQGDSDEVSNRTRDAYLLGADSYDVRARTWYCILRLGLRPVGALALCNTGMKQLTATALASLAAIALERARMLEKQYHTEAARQAEQLRTAVLDSLAHQFKTPLTVIRTASSGLPAAGEMTALQTELISLIDQEARKLNDLASRLVGAPKPDSQEFAPQPEPVLFSRLMKTAIQELEHHVDKHRFRVIVPAGEPTILADRELILTALAQLVDNALKYSMPASPIDVGLVINETAVILTVRSQGLIVQPAERERIFERFYRVPAAQSYSNGTGLGLSIVKTIAHDHQGRVWAEGEAGYGTTFSFALPMAPGGSFRDA